METRTRHLQVNLIFFSKSTYNFDIKLKMFRKLYGKFYRTFSNLFCVSIYYLPFTYLLENILRFEIIIFVFLYITEYLFIFHINKEFNRTASHI